MQMYSYSLDSGSNPSVLAAISPQGLDAPFTIKGAPDQEVSLTYLNHASTRRSEADRSSSWRT